MEHFDPRKMRNVLRTLPPWKRVAFMGSCCERMLPNYLTFSSETGYGDVTQLNRGLAEVWRWVETNQAPNDVDALVQACEQQGPDTAEFRSIYTSAALDAANSIATTLEALGEATEDRAIEVASLARDTIDLFVQQWNDLDPNDSEIERRIVESPLMQSELKMQRQCLERLSDDSVNRKLIVAEVRSKFSYRSLPG